MLSQNPSSIKNVVTKSYFCGSLGISLSSDGIAGRGKAAYIWISPDPVKAGSTLGGGVVVVAVKHLTLNC